MIAKASTIPHGANAIRYSVNKDRADIVKANLLPDDISPEECYEWWYGRVVDDYKKHVRLPRKSTRADLLAET